jgi:hypothetical protein
MSTWSGSKRLVSFFNCLCATQLPCFPVCQQQCRFFFAERWACFAFDAFGCEFGRRQTLADKPLATAVPIHRFHALVELWCVVVLGCRAICLFCHRSKAWMPPVCQVFQHALAKTRHEAVFNAAEE